MGLSMCMHFMYIVCPWLRVLHFVGLVRVNASCVCTEFVYLERFRMCTPCVHVVFVYFAPGCRSCLVHGACMSLYSFCIGKSILCVCWMHILDMGITMYLS